MCESLKICSNVSASLVRFFLHIFFDLPFATFFLHRNMNLIIKIKFSFQSAKNDITFVIPLYLLTKIRFTKKRLEIARWLNFANHSLFRRAFFFTTNKNLTFIMSKWFVNHFFSLSSFCCFVHCQPTSSKSWDQSIRLLMTFPNVENRSKSLFYSVESIRMAKNAQSAQIH